MRVPNAYPAYWIVVGWIVVDLMRAGGSLPVAIVLGVVGLSASFGLANLIWPHIQYGDKV